MHDLMCKCWYLEIKKSIVLRPDILNITIKVTACTCSVSLKSQITFLLTCFNILLFYYFYCNCIYIGIVIYKYADKTAVHAKTVLSSCNISVVIEIFKYSVIRGP